MPISRIQKLQGCCQQNLYISVPGVYCKLRAFSQTMDMLFRAQAILSFQQWRGTQNKLKKNLMQECGSAPGRCGRPRCWS